MCVGAGGSGAQCRRSTPPGSSAPGVWAAGIIELGQIITAMLAYTSVS